jgi:hypothetical protein
LGKDYFKSLVKKIVELNDSHTSNMAGMEVDSQQMDAVEINMLLLDRINEHRSVLQLLVDYQYQNIRTNWPQDFVKPDLKKLDRRDAKEIPLIHKVKK